MRGNLYSYEVIRSQERHEIDDLVGERQMERVLEIVIDSLGANNTVKYKGFLIAMEKSEDPVLRTKAEELGKWIHPYVATYVIRIHTVAIHNYTVNKLWHKSEAK